MGCYIPTLSQSPEVPLLYSIPGHFAHFVVPYYTATGFTVCRYKFYVAMNGQQLTIKTIIIGKHINQCIDLLDDLSTFCGNSRAEWNVTIRRPSFSVYNKLSSTMPQLSVIHTIIIITLAYSCCAAMYRAYDNGQSPDIFRPKQASVQPNQIWPDKFTVHYQN